MTTNANGQPIKLHTELGSFDTEEEYGRAAWAETLRAERERQIEKGYTPEHDQERGADHLIDWAIDYARRGKTVESAALMLALRDLLLPAVPPGVLACTVDESGGMAEIQAAKDLLSAAYGPGEWAVPPETDEAIGELVDAIRLTVEYIGNGWLPPIKGWSWFDALVKYAPEVADEFKRNPIHPVASVPPVTEETVTAVEELDALPRGVVVRADDGLIFERAGWARVYPWRTPNSTHDFSAEQIALPARVLYRPIPEGDKPDA